MFEAFINYPAVFLAGVASFVFGWLWHGPLFGRFWLKLEGFEMPKIITPAVRKQMIKSMSFGFIAQIVSAWGLAYMFFATGIYDLSGAMTIAFVLWLAFVATTLSGGWLWERKSGKLFIFGAVHSLLSLAIMTLVIVLW